MYDYQANIERVVDGDTVRMNIDLGMYVRSSQSIRLLNVHAPELNTPEGHTARMFVQEWVDFHSGGTWPYKVVTEKDKQTFNRYIGVVTCKTCGESLNDAVNRHLGVLA